ncbi:hypothetical protein JCM15415_15550 [Methanobacterium movens]
MEINRLEGTPGCFNPGHITDLISKVGVLMIYVDYFINNSNNLNKSFKLN